MNCLKVFSILVVHHLVSHKGSYICFVHVVGTHRLFKSLIILYIKLNCENFKSGSVFEIFLKVWSGYMHDHEWWIICLKYWKILYEKRFRGNTPRIQIGELKVISFSVTARVHVLWSESLSKCILYLYICMQTLQSLLHNLLSKVLIALHF